MLLLDWALEEQVSALTLLSFASDSSSSQDQSNFYKAPGDSGRGAISLTMLPSNLEHRRSQEREIIFHLARAVLFLFLFLKAAIVILTKALPHRGVRSIQYVSKYKGIRTGTGTKSVLYTCWLILLVMKLLIKIIRQLGRRGVCKNHMVCFDALYQ